MAWRLFESEILVANSRYNILIPFILLLAVSMPRAAAQTNQQLSLTLVGQLTGQYVAPAGETTPLKMEVLNSMRTEIYLVQGKAYLDPDLSGMWELMHSEDLGHFQLSFLQSAIWTFNLAVPAEIQAANVTGNTPQINLLIKIIYQKVGGAQDSEQKSFVLDVPGASIPMHYNVIWYAFGGVLILVCIGTAYVVTKRRRTH